MGFRSLDRKPIPPEVAAAYAEGLEALLTIKPATDEDGTPRPYILKLSEQAHDEWKAFARVVEQDMREGRRFEHITDWAGKLPGAAVRIAGLLHCATHAHAEPWGAEISHDTMKKALNFAAILSHHALAAFDLMGADPALEVARKVLRWIERKRQEFFTARDCFQELKGTFKRMAELDPALAVLRERFYIFDVEEHRRPGRPSRQFRVNQILVKGWS